MRKSYFYSRMMTRDFIAHNMTHSTLLMSIFVIPTKLVKDVYGF